jgi:hypothetical protein
VRARLVLEKFTEKSDPIKDMGIGLYPKYLHILERCLVYNKTHFEVPMRTSYIKNLIYNIKNNKPLDNDDKKDIKKVGNFLVRNRYLEKEDNI